MKAFMLKVVAVVVLAAGAPNGAAAAERVKDPRNPWSLGPARKTPAQAVREEKTAVMPPVYAAVGLLGICAVGFKKPRRTHLD